MRVLVCDDEPLAAAALRAGLERQGLACDVVDYDEEDLVPAARQGCDAILLTTPHARIDARRLIETLRHRQIGVPVLVLQSFRQAGEAALLINAGADDVAAKPVQMAELAARLRGIVRRLNGHVRSSLSVGSLTYFFDGRMPTVAGEPLKLSRRERELLDCLILRQGRIVDRRYIYDSIYGQSGGCVDEKTVDVMMCKVRKKLRTLSRGEDYIQTFPGQGYRFVAPEQVRKEGRCVVVALGGRPAPALRAVSA